MNFIRVALRSVNDGFYHRQFNRSVTSFTPNNSISGPGNEGNLDGNLSESNEEFEKRMFSGGSNGKSSCLYSMLDGMEKGGFGQRMGSNADQSSTFGGLSDDKSSSFFSKLDGMGKAGFGQRIGSNGDQSSTFGGVSDDNGSSLYRTLGRMSRLGQGMGSVGDRNDSGLFSGNNDDFSSLTDGMDGKLKQAAAYFEVNPEEIAAEEYTFRPDVNLKSGMTYTPKDLDLKKEGVWRPSKRREFEVTTKEVLEKADFRNVRFLSNFLTEAGIIIKRSKTGISAKAQRKIAREIKTARAFGLLPFTTMGTKAFVYGKTMEDNEYDFQPDAYDNQADVDDAQDPLAG